jgi:hypothetical protein
MSQMASDLKAEKTKYTLLSRPRNAGQIHDIMTATRFLGNVTQFKYLGTTIINQNLIQEKLRGD